MYVPLQYSCTLYIEPILVFISVEKQQTKTFISYPIAKYVSPENMPCIYHICILVEMHIWRKHTNIYATYEVTCNNNHYLYTLQATIHHIVIGNEQIWLLHYKHYVLLHYYCSLHIECTYRYSRNNKTQCLFHILLPYMFHLKIYPWNIIYMPYMQIS